MQWETFMEGAEGSAAPGMGPWYSWFMSLRNDMSPLRAIAMGFLALACVAGCKAKPPGNLESKSVRWAKHHITIGGRKDHSPLTASNENIQAGKQAFGDYCVVCHGRDGQNTGVPFADKMAPPVPSLADSEVQAYSDGQLKWIINNGIFPSGMPASRGILSDEEMWQIVLYIRHLPPAGSLGDPRAYSGDEYGESDTTKK
jgi:mono/diheme cytochrome c family protein